MSLSCGEKETVCEYGSAGCVEGGGTLYLLLLFLWWVLREGSVEFVTGGDLTFIWEQRDRLSLLHIVIIENTQETAYRVTPPWVCHRAPTVQNNTLVPHTQLYDVPT